MHQCPVRTSTHTRSAASAGTGVISRAVTASFIQCHLFSHSPITPSIPTCDHSHVPSHPVLLGVLKPEAASTHGHSSPFSQLQHPQPYCAQHVLSCCSPCAHPCPAAALPKHPMAPRCDTKNPGTRQGSNLGKQTLLARLMEGSVWFGLVRKAILNSSLETLELIPGES